MDEKIMLKVENLSVNYGHIEALKNVSVDVKKGQICSIIGANGAGKSTLLKTISGLVKPVSGTIYFEGKPLPKRAHKIVAEGIVHVPEGRKTFSGLTIEDNLLVGGTVANKSRLAANLEKQYQLFPILKERKNQFAGTLSGGEQQMLAVARGLMSEPKNGGQECTHRSRCSSDQGCEALCFDGGCPSTTNRLGLRVRQTPQCNAALRMRKVL